VEFLPDVDWILDEIPPWLTPVAYLAGSHWPQGKVRAWRAIAGFAGDAAEQLEPLIERLIHQRSHTQAAVVGQTAHGADQQFATLLEGPDSLPKLAQGLRTLTDTANSTATQIESAQWGIVSTLAMAYWSLRVAYATFVVDPVGSLAEVSIIEALAELTIREVWSLAMKRVEAVLAETEAKDVLMELLTGGVRAAGLGAAQELGIEGIEVLEGHRSGIDVAAVGDSALSMGVAGLAGGMVGHVIGGVVGTDGSLGLRVAKGALTGLATGEAANVAGTLAGGGHLGADTWVGGALGVADGGLNGVLGQHGSASESRISVHDPAEGSVAANAIDTHSTVRLEKRPDGTFYWPGEQTGAAGNRANDGALQAHPATPPAPAADWGAASGERATGSPSNGSVGAGDAGARSPKGPTTGHAAPPRDTEGPGPRAGEGIPAAMGTAASPADHFTAGAGPTHPQTTTCLGASVPPEGRLDLSTIRPPACAAAAIDVASPRVSEPLSRSDATGASSLPRALPRPDPPAPSVAPGAVSADHIFGIGPTADARGGLADSSTSGKSASESPWVPAVRYLDTTAAHANPAVHDTSVCRPANAAGPGAGSHIAARQDVVAVERQKRPAHLVTKRQDPSTRPDVNRHDPSTGPRGRPTKLRRSDVGCDVSQVLQPTAAARAPGLPAAAEDTDVIKARYDDSGPGPGEPESHPGGRDGSDGHNTPDPAMAGGGAGDGSSDRGSAGKRGPGDGGDHDGDSHPVERYFQTYRPFEDATENRQRGDDARVADAYPPVADYTADAVGFGRLLAVLRNNNTDMTQFQLGVDSGLRAISKTYIARIENGDRMPSRAQARNLLVALKVPDPLRQQYLDHFYPPVDTTLANYTADAVGFGRWLAALRDTAGMTHRQLATAAGFQTEYVKQIERTGHFIPSLPRFRQLYDALNIHGPPRIEAVRHFHCHRYPSGVDPDQERDFWDLVDTEVGSRQEEKQRNLIYERYGYDDEIAKPVARTWARFLYDHYGLKADRDDLYEEACDVILTAMHYHVPTAPFIAHAWANCRGAIHRIAEAALEIRRHEVSLVVSRSSEQTQRQLPDPTATQAFEDIEVEDIDVEDQDFADSVRAALAGLHNIDKATRLVTLIVKHDIPLDLAAQQLGLPPQIATKIISTAIPRLHTAFQPPPPDDT
jgi:transcriptional regulator with XRE-family HTH domain